MGYETVNPLHGRTHNPWDLDPHAGRVERRRVGGDRRRVLGRRPGQRRRRIDSGAGALHRHLRAQADAGPGALDRSPAGVPRPVLAHRRGRTDGAHDRRPRSDVSRPERVGRGRSLRDAAGGRHRAARRRPVARRLVRPAPRRAGHGGDRRAPSSARSRALAAQGMAVEERRPAGARSRRASCGTSSSARWATCCCAPRSATTPAQLPILQAYFDSACPIAAAERVAAGAGVDRSRRRCAPSWSPTWRPAACWSARSRPCRRSATASAGWTRRRRRRRLPRRDALHPVVQRARQPGGGGAGRDLARGAADRRAGGGAARSRRCACCRWPRRSSAAAAASWPPPVAR